MTTVRAPGRTITIGEACQKLNPGLFRKLDPETKQILHKKRIRQSSKPLMNKLESEAMEWLKGNYPRWLFRAKALTLFLANGCKYTVDIVGFNPNISPQISAYEVKGKHAWDDSIVKLKVAAHEWPSIDFFLIWKADGIWQTQKVLP